MKRNDLLLATVLSRDPIRQRRQRMRMWRAFIAQLTLIGLAGLLVVGALWFVCAGVVTR